MMFQHLMSYFVIIINLAPYNRAAKVLLDRKMISDFTIAYPHVWEDNFASNFHIILYPNKRLIPKTGSRFAEIELKNCEKKPEDVRNRCRTTYA